SIGSPSSPFVPGMKPKSNGKHAPIGSALDSRQTCVLSSYLYLFRERFGVSTTTLNSRVSESRGGNCCKADCMQHLVGSSQRLRCNYDAAGRSMMSQAARTSS